MSRTKKTCFAGIDKDHIDALFSNINPGQVSDSESSTASSLAPEQSLEKPGKKNGQVKRKASRNASSETEEQQDDAGDLTNKAKRRRMQNRLAAQKSRDNKKAYIGKLESQIDDLKRANEELHQRLAALAKENNSLKTTVPSKPMAFSKETKAQVEEEVDQSIFDNSAVVIPQQSGILAIFTLILTVLSTLQNNAELMGNPECQELLSHMVNFLPYQYLSKQQLMTLSSTHFPLPLKKKRP